MMGEFIEWVVVAIEFLLTLTVNTGAAILSVVAYESSTKTYWVDIARVGLFAFVFLYASYRDIKERIVKDYVWIPIYTLGIVFIAYELFTGNTEQLLPWMSGNILFAFLMGYLLYWTNVFGGADRKALIGIAILFPTYPLLGSFPLVMPPVVEAPLNSLNIFSLTILTNTVLVSLFYPVKTLIQNTASGNLNIKRPGLMLTAYAIQPANIPNVHGKILPTWEFRNDTIAYRTIALFRTIKYGIDAGFIRDYMKWHKKHSDDDVSNIGDITHVYLQRFLESKANKDENGDTLWKKTVDTEKAQQAVLTVASKNNVWITPGIPFIVPMSIGILISIVIGDLTFYVLDIFFNTRI